MDPSNHHEPDLPDRSGRPHPLTRAIRSQADLHHRWRLLMGEPGFAEEALWCLLLDGDGRPSGQLLQIAETPDLPDRTALGHLMSLLGDLEPHSVAFLRSRPGRARLTRADRAWARETLTAAQQAGLSTWPVHLACDETVLVVSPDDLAGAGPA